MKLENYPTPETDAMENLRFTSSALFAKSRSLERRLEYCHETLTIIVNNVLTLDHIEKIAEKSLEETKP
jgi:hypothetical protein